MRFKGTTASCTSFNKNMKGKEGRGGKGREGDMLTGFSLHVTKTLPNF
jgi:hypothetical protein